MSNVNHFVGREALLSKAGVDIKTLGYVGLTFEPLPVREMLDSMAWGVPVLEGDYVYAPEGDYRSWVNGPVGEQHAHVTAKYGFITPSYERKDIINELIGWPRAVSVEVTGIEIFPSPYPDLEYGCLVARLGGDDLLEMNAALSTLPHVDSFTEYKPHLTLAYIVPHVCSYAALPLARDYLLGKTLEVTGIDYGKVR